MHDMQSEYPQKICPACFDDEALDGELLKNAIDYANSLREELCVGDAEYRQRLVICAGCDNLSRGVCGKCGCFVIVRAKRRNKSCPMDEDKWAKQL